MKAEANYLSVGGSRVYYEKQGEGKPVLLLHGGLGTVADFASQTQELAMQYKVYAFERRGHGHTADVQGPLSFNIMAKDTVAFIEALGIGETNLIGWSDGAIIAILVAISRPELVRSLISIGGIFNTTGLTSGFRAWTESATAESLRQAVPTMVERYERATPDGSADFSNLWEKTKRMWLSEPDIRSEELAQISAPTLIMAGDKDVIPIEHTAEMFRSINGAQLCIVPGATHLLLSEKPEIVNRVILGFLEATNRLS